MNCSQLAAPECFPAANRTRPDVFLRTIGLTSRAMKVHEIMTTHARCVSSNNTLVDAARLMRELDVGALPVLDSDQLTGIVTDRGLVVRGVADGKDPSATAVNEVMSMGAIFVSADAPVEEAARIMEEKQIRRLPVLGRDRQLVGIVSLGDIATSSNPAFSGTTL